MWTRTPDFSKKLNILGAEGLPSGDDQVEWLGRRPSKGMLIVNSVLNAPSFDSQNACKQIIDFAPRRHDQCDFWRSGRNCTVTGTFHTCACHAEIAINP